MSNKRVFYYGLLVEEFFIIEYQLDDFVIFLGQLEEMLIFVIK